MKRQIVKLLIAFAAAAIAGTTTSCNGTDNSPAAPGGPNRITFNLTLTGTQTVPATNSAGAADVTVALDKTTGAITVTGTFSVLSSPATAAHVHGPAAVGSSGPVLFTLTVPPDVSGTVIGSASMSTAQMTDMLNRMTYVDIHTHYFSDGEIRAQVTD
jgi:hypothetical protein